MLADKINIRLEAAPSMATALSLIHISQRKEAYELIDNTCSEMMASGDSFRRYLDVQGRFDRYSVANAILVSAQMPEATQLKAVSYTHLDVYKRQIQSL